MQYEDILVLAKYKPYLDSGHIGGTVLSACSLNKAEFEFDQSLETLGTTTEPQVVDFVHRNLYTPRW